MSLRTPTTLFKDSLTMYKAHFWFMLGITVFPIVIIMPYLILSGILGAITQWMPLMALLILVGVIGGVTLLLAAKVSLLKYVASPESYNSITDLYISTKPLLLPYLFVGIITGIGFVIGLILLIIPGIIFLLWYGFSSYTCIYDNKRGLDALKESKRLVEGNMIAVLVRSVVFMVGYILIFIIISLLFPGRTGDVLGNIISVIVGPLVVLYFYNIYVDLKAMKDSGSEIEVVSEPTDATQIA